MSNLFCGTVEIFGLNEALSTKNEMSFKLYKIELDNYKDLISVLSKNLNAQEILRSQKYHFDKDRDRFIICRSILKLLLAEHLGLEARKIAIELHQNKKPYLSAYPSIFFNVSHTGNYALIAICGNTIGVDIEKIDASFNYTETLPHIFNKTEINIVSNTQDLNRTFFKFWTRKEAIVKATGKGIGDDITKIPASDGLHIIQSELLGNISSLLVISFELDQDYIGSVAYVGDKNEINQLQFSPLPLLEGKY